MIAYRKQLLMGMLLDKKLASQMTPNAVKKYYNSHRDEFSSDQVRLQQIVVSDENDAKRLFKLAKDPKSDFQELAEKNSQDPNAKNSRGEMGFVSRGAFSPEFTSVAFSTPAGEVAGPIHTRLGYHIIKVIQKRIGKSFEFDEVEHQVRAALHHQLIRNFTDGVKGQAKIELNNAALEKM